MGQWLTEIGALVRSLRMAAGLPSAAKAAYRSLPRLTEAYEEVVAPLLTQTLTDPCDRDRADRSLRVMSVKFGLVMLAYARLTRRRPRLDVVILAGGITRLYDDIIDGNVEDPSADARLAELLGNRPVTAGTDAELLLGRLVFEIDRRLDHTPDDSTYVALASLHEYQVLSRRQLEANIPVDVLEKITRGKGRAANLILCSIVNPGLESAEQELAMDLGETLQSLDDYMDVDPDRAHGVTTPSTLGLITLPQIARRLRGVKPRLVACYGRRSAGPYCGVLYFLLLEAWVARRLPVLDRLARRHAQRSAVLAFLTRGADALPPAGAETRP
jgi:hypothetical protein